LVALVNSKTMVGQQICVRNAADKRRALYRLQLTPNYTSVIKLASSRLHKCISWKIQHRGGIGSLKQYLCRVWA